MNVPVIVSVRIIVSYMLWIWILAQIKHTGDHWGRSACCRNKFHVRIDLSFTFIFASRRHATCVSYTSNGKREKKQATGRTERVLTEQVLKAQGALPGIKSIDSKLSGMRRSLVDRHQNVKCIPVAGGASGGPVRFARSHGRSGSYYIIRSQCEIETRVSALGCCRQ